MASDTNAESEFTSFVERFMSQRALSLFLPFMFGSTNPNTNQENPEERVILINPVTQRMILIEGATGLDSIFTKTGQPPASKSSIEAMPSLQIDEKDVDSECVICLEEFELGGTVKSMPCEHKFHGDCIEKWLSIHGSCPVCRYKMPVEEEEIKTKIEEEDGGREGRRIGNQIWITFSVDRSRNEQQQIHNSNQAPDSSEREVNQDI